MYHMYTSIKCPLLYFLLHSIVINRNIDIYIIKGRNATLRRKSNLSLISFKLIRVNCIQLI